MGLGRVKPVEQKAVVGGVKPLLVSTQCETATVPIPVVDVVEALPENFTDGGAKGVVKPCAAIQTSNVTALVLVICRTDPKVCDSPGVPGEFEFAESV